MGQNKSKQNKRHTEIEDDCLLNVEKQKSRMVWTSLGIAMNTLPFLDILEMLNLQILNKFCYKIAVSRV